VRCEVGELHLPGIGCCMIFFYTQFVVCCACFVSDFFSYLCRTPLSLLPLIHRLSKFPFSFPTPHRTLAWELHALVRPRPSLTGIKSLQTLSLVRPAQYAFGSCTRSHFVLRSLLSSFTLYFFSPIFLCTLIYISFLHTFIY
jgi:hypothetical protein